MMYDFNLVLSWYCRVYILCVRRYVVMDIGDSRLLDDRLERVIGSARGAFGR